ncbi:MAG TPA: hypothetical protein VK308_13545 [Pyrinomonadaceae bacterium]|jgi:uncharacterized membrane protein|nr:hypothetical protein [Pyrinomonadaceae bacterium]
MSYQYANNAAATQQSSFGLSPNLAALISYIWIPITSVLVLVTEKENRMVRFHAWQSIFLGCGFAALSIVLSIVIGIIMLVAGAISPYAGILVSVLSLIVWMIIALVMLGVWVFCLIKAYQGAIYRLPLVGKFAEQIANK